PVDRDRLGARTGPAQHFGPPALTTGVLHHQLPVTKAAHRDHRISLLVREGLLAEVVDVQFPTGLLDRSEGGRGLSDATPGHQGQARGVLNRARPYPAGLSDLLFGASASH